MFSHIMVGSNDIARSRSLRRNLRSAGRQSSSPDAKGRLAYAHNGGRFMVSKPITASLPAQPMVVRSAP